MAFKSPIASPLTEAQSQAIAKFSAMKTFLTPQKRNNVNIPKNKQISSYDFLVEMAKTILGPAIVTVLIKSFLEKLFDKNNKKLENATINALSKSMAKKGEKIQPGFSDKEDELENQNKQWLRQNVLPSFNLSKDVIAMMIISMIFGPKTKMEEYVEKSSSNNSTSFQGELNERKSRILDSAACSEQMFSLSNLPSEPQGNVEYNKVQLKKRLESGNVEFIISCQEVKIKLPENTEQVLGVGSDQNSANVFVRLNDYVSQESTKQNGIQNNNAVNKTFLESMNEKLFQTLPMSVGLQMDSVFEKINEENQSLGLNFENSIGYTCDISSGCDDSEEFKKKSAFTSALINIIYALLISILFSEITNRIKKLIKQAFAERSRRKSERLLEKQKQRFASLGGGIVGKIGQAAQKIKQGKLVQEALKSVNEIFDFIKEI